MNVIDKFREIECEKISFLELEAIELNEVKELYPEYPGAVKFTRVESRMNPCYST